MRAWLMSARASRAANSGAEKRSHAALDRTEFYNVEAFFQTRHGKPLLPCLAMGRMPSCHICRNDPDSLATHQARRARRHAADVPEQVVESPQGNRTQMGSREGGHRGARGGKPGAIPPGRRKRGHSMRSAARGCIVPPSAGTGSCDPITRAGQPAPPADRARYGRTGRSMAARGLAGRRSDRGTLPPTRSDRRASGEGAGSRRPSWGRSPIRLAANPTASRSRWAAAACSISRSALANSRCAVPENRAGGIKPRCVSRR